MEIPLSAILNDLKQSEALLKLKLDAMPYNYYAMRFGIIYSTVRTSRELLEHYIREERK